MSWAAAIPFIQGGLSLFSGYKSSQSYKEGGKLAKEAAYANAADLRELAEFNRSGYLQAGAINASAIRTVGEANAIAVQNATARNMQMFGMQSDEDRRRFNIGAKVMAGSIRAMAGASGVQTNTGSPLYYLNSQVSLKIRERRYADIRTYWTLRNMFEEGEEKASVIRLSAEQQAWATEANAAIQAEMSYLEAMRQATAMERSGDVQAQVGAAQGSAAMWGGIGGAIGGISQGIAGIAQMSQMQTPYQGYTYQSWNQSTGWMNPGASYGPMFGYGGY